MDEMAGRPIAGLRACGLVAAWMLGALANAAHAQAIPSWHDEYTKRLKYEEVTSPLKDDLFGDNISLYDGTVTFSATDVSLTGNSALPVSIGRRYTVDDPGHDEQDDADPADRPEATADRAEQGCPLARLHGPCDRHDDQGQEQHPANPDDGGEDVNENANLVHAAD